MELLTTALAAFAFAEFVKALFLAFGTTLYPLAKQGLVFSGLAVGLWWGDASLVLAAAGAAFLVHTLYRTLRAVSDRQRHEVMRGAVRRNLPL